MTLTAQQRDQLATEAATVLSWYRLHFLRKFRLFAELHHGRAVVARLEHAREWAIVSEWSETWQR